MTSIAGTTRDLIESSFDIGGFPVILSDTAGLRHTSDVIEEEGILRAKNCAILADLIMIVIDAANLEEYFTGKSIDIKEYLDSFYLKSLGLDLELLQAKRSVIIVNKIDLLDEETKN